MPREVSHDGNEQKKEDILDIRGCLGRSLVYAIVVETARRPAYQQQLAPGKPTPFGNARQPVFRPPVAPFRELIGLYAGRTALPSRGLCNLRFELRDNRAQAGAFFGYSTLVCMPLVQKRWQQNMYTAAIGPRPTSAILSGEVENGGIRFRVDDTISVAEGCKPTAFVIKPFGTNQIAASWVDSCKGGSMMLTRAGR
jgi:hypothetical protein